MLREALPPGAAREEAFNPSPKPGREEGEWEWAGRLGAPGHWTVWQADGDAVCASDAVMQ